MDYSKLHDFVLMTEAKLQFVENAKGLVSSSRQEWTMWLPREKFIKPESSDLSLVPVIDDGSWEAMFYLRSEVEGQYGNDDPKILKTLLSDIKSKISLLNGKWFLAKVGEKVIGGFGVVPFRFGSRLIGRLQNIDVTPNFQGQGYGNLMMAAICKTAIAFEFDSLCLMANSNGWPKNWYEKIGFVKVGETETLQEKSSMPLALDQNQQP